MKEKKEHEDEKIEEIFSLVEELFGNYARIVFEYLSTNPRSSEFDINKATGMSLRDVRSCLYDMCGSGILEFERTKDEEKGWYLYSWSVATGK